MQTIPFNKPCHTGFEDIHIARAISTGKLSGDGDFTKRCAGILERASGSGKVMLVTSCTHALDMSALLLELQAGDEVILPSFTFVSTANAFALRGATLVFVDIRPDTMNMDENMIEDAVTRRTKAIVPVHYAGVGCEMDTIMAVARGHSLSIVEDAAQGVNASYKGKPLGTFGDLGAYSFHETKNYTCGEGGALLVNRPGLVERAEVVREKGTNRTRFFRGEVDKYTWVDLGSSYLLSELNAAYLLGQLEHLEMIQEDRMRSWKRYVELLAPLASRGVLELPSIPAHCRHNAHILYVKVANLRTRTMLIEFLKEEGISAVFHYIPLHSSPAGRRHGRFHGTDRWTTSESERLLRLPLYYGMTDSELNAVTDAIGGFFA